jgi:hypothetical protein
MTITVRDNSYLGLGSFVQVLRNGRRLGRIVHAAGQVCDDRAPTLVPLDPCRDELSHAHLRGRSARLGLPGPQPRARRANGPRGWGQRDARTGESEHNAVEVNPPDYRLDCPGAPMRREEIETPFRARLGHLGEAYFGPAWVQVDERKSQPAVARFKDDRPRADLARIASQLRRLPLCRPPAGLVGEHGGWAYRRHRASNRSVVLLELSSRAIFALGRGLPIMGFAMLGQSAGIPSPPRPRKEREQLGRKGGLIR